MECMKEPENGVPTRVIGYLRVSTAGQEATGYGLGAQRSAIEDACTQRGFTLVDVVVESVTGSKVGPLQAATLKRMDAHEADILMVSKLDRLTRSVINGATLLERAEKRGWGLVALDVGVDMTTPAGRMIAHIMMIFAQFERDVIRQRTKDGLAVAKAKGILPGPKAGYDPALLESVRVWRSDGRTWAWIADQLNDLGMPTGTGGKWNRHTIRVVYVRSDALAASQARQQAESAAA
jgi:DNA invertase Pin-like site-specific DNA recombinase